MRPVFRALVSFLLTFIYIRAIYDDATAHLNGAVATAGATEAQVCSHFFFSILTNHQEILKIHIRHYEPPKCIVDGRLCYELVTIL